MNPPLLTGLLIFLSSLAISADDDPLAVWSGGVEIAPVSDAAGRHSIHTYYLTNPERPDGKKVLYFTSTHPAA
ncbi:MAG: hypothetical protein KA152_03875 [Verrucomicrobiales bacterium]|nr:hypothetical protein [Verrucomicrobiales bacterium]